MNYDARVRICPQFKSGLRSLSDDELRAKSGLWRPQPEQHDVQAQTVLEWEIYATDTKDESLMRYGNVPLLAMAEILRRRTGSDPTVAEIVAATIAAGFSPARSTTEWQGERLRKELADYLDSAKKRGFCELVST